MTKKDFELIVAVFAAEPVQLLEDREIIENLAESLADALATTNPKFDRARFLAACGVQS